MCRKIVCLDDNVGLRTGHVHGVSIQRARRAGMVSSDARDATKEHA